MKVVHLCLSCFYIDGFSYQENEIVKQHVKDGHEVTVIASTETYESGQKLSYLTPSTYLGTDGAKVIRLPYRKLLPHGIMKKLRMYTGVLKRLKEERPDVIMCHGLCTWELLTVSQYCKDSPEVSFYADSHADFNNSAQNFISKYLLHSLYYKLIVKRCLPRIKSVLCISLEVLEFAAEVYNIPRDKLEFFPLGGEIFPDDEYNERRERYRTKLNLNTSDILFVQTGKFGQRKKLVESLSAFTKLRAKNIHFVLVGTIGEDIEEFARPLIEGDERIHFLGWKNSQEIRDLLCAADLYVQPGTQSATMQMSLCARCPVILDDVLSHQPFVSENGWLISNQEELESVLFKISEGDAPLMEMSKKSHVIAKELLDYSEISKRVL